MLDVIWKAVFQTDLRSLSFINYKEQKSALLLIFAGINDFLVEWFWHQSTKSQLLYAEWSLDAKCGLAGINFEKGFLFSSCNNKPSNADILSLSVDKFYQVHDIIRSYGALHRSFHIFYDWIISPVGYESGSISTAPGAMIGESFFQQLMKCQ